MHHGHSRLPLIFKDWIPSFHICQPWCDNNEKFTPVSRTKVCWSTWWHNLAISNALEQQGFMARTRCVCKGTYGLRRLVLISSEEIVEPAMADGVQEPFTGGIAPYSV